MAQFKIENVDELTPEQIAKLKEQHGPLFKTEVSGTKYLCRLLFKPDWDIINKLAEDNQGITVGELDEKIVNVCVLGPIPKIDDGGWSGKPAGVTQTLSQTIRAKSGFIVQGMEKVSFPVVTNATIPEEVEKPTEMEIETLRHMSPFDLKTVTFDADIFVIRPIARSEFKQIVKEVPEDEHDLAIAKKTVLWPREIDWDKKPAGYPESVFQIVMAISGFSGPTTVEDL